MAIKNYIKLKLDDKYGPILYLTIRKKCFGFCLCHHDPKRSIKFFGIERFLCARCTGILIGVIITYLFDIWRFFGLFWALIFVIPLIIDGFTQLFQWRESCNEIRLITGILTGISIPIFCNLFVSIVSYFQTHSF